MDFDSFQKTQQSIDLLIKTHQRLRFLQQENQALKTHLSILQKDNEKLSSSFDKLLQQNQTLTLQKQNLRKINQRLESENKQQRHRFDYPLHLPQNEYEVKAQVKAKNITERINSTIEEYETKRKSTLKTIQQKSIFDDYLQINEPKNGKSKLEKKLYRSISNKELGVENLSKVRSPLIKKNFERNQTNIGKGNLFNKKFNYTQWRKDNNNSVIWKNPNNLLL